VLHAKLKLIVSSWNLKRQVYMVWPHSTQFDFHCKSSTLTTTQDLPIRQFLLGNLRRQPGGQTQTFRIPLDILGRTLDNLGDFPFTNPDATRFEKPALFVRGTKSKYVPDEVLPLIGRFFPRFRLSDIDAGHWLISEQPEAFRKGL
jgi:pimeloyl-ACP methyl ester carboxylesterase